VIHYPAELEDTAIRLGKELAFCSSCECGTVYFVVLWHGDRARIMSSGGIDLAEDFEAHPLWSDELHVDEHGLFPYSVIDDPLEINAFLDR
jgi:hypothetical protein